jgi:hypothetical protein
VNETIMFVTGVGTKEWVPTDATVTEKLQETQIWLVQILSNSPSNLALRKSYKNGMRAISDKKN